MKRLVALVLFLTLLGHGAMLVAQTPKVMAPAATDKKAKDDKKEAKKEEEKDTFFHLKNVKLHPVVGPVLYGVDLLIKNGKIDAIGRELEVPEEAEALDAQGLHAYPGLLSLNGDGILGGGSGKWEDRIDPFSIKTLMGLANGITTVVSRSTAVKLVHGTVDGAVLRDNLYMGLFYSASNPQGKAQLRKDLSKVRTYIRELAVYTAKAAKKDPKAKKPDEKKLGSAKRYLPLLQGQVIGVFNVRDTSDLLGVCELASTFGFRPLVRGVTEGWCVADELGRAGVRAVITPRERRDPKPELIRPNGSSIENAAILYKHGVPIAIAAKGGSIELDGGAGQDALALIADAGFAVRGGLPEDAALRAITIEAARAYGLDDRIGSLEIGKDADIVLTAGNILHYRNLVQFAFVNGRLVYDKSKESLYAHIHSRDPNFKPTGQFWPRRRKPMMDNWDFDASEWARKQLDKKSTPEKKSAPADAKKADEKASRPTRRPGTRGGRRPRIPGRRPSEKK